MKEHSLNDYMPNVSCPHCQDDSDVTSSQRLCDQEMLVWQRCRRCGKVWEETWELTKVEVAQSEGEEEELDFLHRHPESI